jgi:hypothetical protein
LLTSAGFPARKTSPALTVIEVSNRPLGERASMTQGKAGRAVAGIASAIVPGAKVRTTSPSTAG